jgi:hypothetical protein
MKNKPEWFHSRQILASIIIFVSIFLHFYDSKLSQEEVNVMYVARDEIIDLEKARIRELKYPSNTGLFFGRIDKALEILQQIVREHNSKKNSFVIITKNKITGPGVQSISKEIYQEIIRRLELE